MAFFGLALRFLVADPCLVYHGLVHRRDEAIFQFPMLRSEGLKGAIIYYDGQVMFIINKHG